MQWEPSSLITIDVGGTSRTLTWGEFTASVAEAQTSSYSASLDLFWLLFGGVLVFLMMLGLALLEIGCVHKKNTKHIMIRILCDCCLTGLTFYATGYSFAFTHGNGFIGSSGFFMQGADFTGATATQAFRGHHYADWFFQWAIASVAVNICHGAVAERISLSAYAVYSFCASLFIYPVCAHWAWAETGWASMLNEGNLLFDIGVMDFAGTGCLHMFAGTSALVGCLLLGPRLGKFTAEGHGHLPSQSVLLQFMGTMILWFGWYGFNCIVYALAVFAFVGVCVSIIFGSMKALGYLRVSAEAERMGMDAFEHGGSAYDNGEDDEHTNKESYNNSLQSPAARRDVV
ncbi:hypothetical protein SDRG_14028 [Saprolegnia diclina VS20]|uniref:Ammonium transporter AmtB-like domain-containing protein n=1 Tax=Saprolegnia diclina (strain VS20) TaxID=1156394 RepID=T0PRT2_SAPDV|nr:hypothetical protein SDRG_14028 [Saprolegnia diclina VS20]EQC28204.1 hypothetical protein SDRG_14028 [Saprolegnia diclina VS20]|eukprot:XP_008618353.1 hypothetical protein SDRG_14028 [Saprolegnia diclina VS20]